MSVANAPGNRREAETGSNFFSCVVGFINRRGRRGGGWDTDGGRLDKRGRGYDG